MGEASPGANGGARATTIFRAGVLTLLLAVLGTGLAYLALSAGDSSDRIEIILPTEAPPGPVVVHVAGAVAREGVYTLTEGDRVLDAIEAAGGLAADADQSSANLAQVLVDGDQVVVRRVGDAAGLAGAQTDASLVNLNTASQAQLEGLDGIGPVRARAIIDYREANGGFERIEDLLLVDGIGTGTLSALRSFVTVG